MACIGRSYCRDVNGKMLVINGQAETFYSHQIDRTPGIFNPALILQACLLMNVNTPGTCAPNPLLPDISIRVEYLSEANTWVSLNGFTICCSCYCPNCKCNLGTNWGFFYFTFHRSLFSKEPEDCSFRWNCRWLWK